MAAEKPAAANNDKYALIMAYLHYCKQGKLDLDEAAKDETINAASRQACYDKLKFILKKEGLTVGGVFNTSAAGAPATSASKTADGEDDASGGKKTKPRATRRKKVKSEDGEDVKTAKKRKVDDVEDEDAGERGVKAEVEEEDE